MSENYQTPPIIEAVVEFRFAEPISFETIVKKADRIKRLYPQETQTYEFSGEFSERGWSGTQTVVGLRLTTKNDLEIVLVNLQNYIIARLAPYVGWEEFKARVIRDYGILSESYGRRSIARIGVRYINRIDVPTTPTDVDRYLTVFPSVPSFGQTYAKGFALQSTFEYSDPRFTVTLQSATVDAPPVPGTNALLLDIDVACTVDIPTRDDQILQLLDDMRAIKNSVFEAAITDEARKLFR